MTNPKISIITITFNNPNLKRTLDSILTQKNYNFDIEHIIVDNLSEDNTENIVQDYIKKVHYNVVYIREKDKGMYDAMNKGIKIAKGEYLSFMNAGDHFYDGNSMFNIVNNSKNYDIIYGNLNVVNKEISSIYCPPNFIDLKYFFESALPHQASLIKKELFYKIGFYDDTLKIASDWKFFLLAICKFKFKYLHIDKIIATYYFDGISSLESSIPLNNLEKIQTFNHYFSSFGVKNVFRNGDDIEKSFKTPILFLIFNRPELTRRVFNEIKKIKPKYLFISADGPREKKEGEKEKCQEVRNIIDDIDWNCEVKTLFRNINFGCGHAVSMGISWFFENVEEGIILEDDCLPSESFFYYCEELLNKYRYDNRISHINGTSFVCRENIESSFYYSKYYHVWGWATWRRSWNLYDFSMRSFPEFCSSNQIKNIFFDINIQNFWLSCFNEIFIEKKDTWDYQWVYTNLINNNLSIMPYVNLVTNIGFGKDATHTLNYNDQNANREVGNIFNIRYPKFVIHDVILDNNIYETHIKLPLNQSFLKNNFLIKIIFTPFYFKKIIKRISKIIPEGLIKEILKKIYFFI